MKRVSALDVYKRQGHGDYQVLDGPLAQSGTQLLLGDGLLFQRQLHDCLLYTSRSTDSWALTGRERPQ